MLFKQFRFLPPPFATPPWGLRFRVGLHIVRTCAGDRAVSPPPARWQLSMQAIYACLPFCMCVYILAAVRRVCGCAMWLNTFCSINKPRRGSQLASAHFSVRHVSNLLRKIFFNLAIGSRPAPFSIDPWHAWHLASGTCWRHISVQDWRQSVCALIGTTI